MMNGQRQRIRKWKRSGAKALLLLPALCLISCSFYDSSSSPKQRAGAVPGKVVTVKAHENIYSIAQDNSASMRDIIILNGLHEPYDLKPGQTLIMPFKRSDVALLDQAPEPLPAPALGTIQQAPLSSVEAQPLAPLAPPATVAPVRTTITPAPLQQPPVKTQSPFSSGVASAPVQALNVPSPPPPKPVTTIASAEQASIAAAPAASPSSPPPPMIWPVQGAILSGFGPKGQGVNNDGVNIGAPKGAPVVAAAAGTVVYAGNEMKGFGNLILIRHQGNWVTAYAYLDRMLVSKDAIVAQGDMIGTVGKTGNVATPQLHFETRHDGKVVDPSGVVKAP